MSDLSPVAFDIETSGLDPSAVITVVGFALDNGSWLALNTAGRYASKTRLQTAVEHESGSNIELAVYENEQALMNGMAAFAHERVNGDHHYLTAYNGERWNGGFDLPFVRSVCVRHDITWPFPDIAYADTMDMMERFDTGDVSDLVGVYDVLVGEEDCDPFTDSASAVRCYEDGDWESLLLHNLADIERTRELAVLAGRYVPRSDFNMKNLSPP